MRINQGQEFVIAGFTPSDKNFDALIIGYYEKGKLLYAGRTRNGFTPAIRVELAKRLRPLQVAEFGAIALRRLDRGTHPAMTPDQPGVFVSKCLDRRAMRPALDLWFATCAMLK
jgi:ATP-dependent DNA ligase